MIRTPNSTGGFAIYDIQDFRMDELELDVNTYIKQIEPFGQYKVLLEVLEYTKEEIQMNEEVDEE